MKCRICARECPPGAKLCRDCAAARKRAFAATVTQPLLAAAGVPSVGRPRFAPRPVRPRATGKPAANPARSEAVMAASAAERMQAPAKAIGVQWLLLALALACAIVYLLIRVIFAPHAPSGDEAIAPAATVAAPPAVDAGSLAPSAPPEHPAVASPGTTESVAGTAAALKDAKAKAARHKTANKAETPVAAVPETPPPAPPQPAPAPRAPQAVAEAPRDPWAEMNEGLSRCAKVDAFKRSECEQRLRLQYCPNHWGVVWQCPIGPATDHGQ